MGAGGGGRMFGLGVRPHRRAGWEGPEQDVGAGLVSVAAVKENSNLVK